MNVNAMRIAAEIRLWNALIPASAVRVERRSTHVRYLHPTKGWRHVSNRRLQIG